MRAPAVDVTEIAERLACCSDELDATDRVAQLALLRLLAAGRPVEPIRLATRASLEIADAIARVERWPEVQTDDQGRVVAFRGLSVIEAPHRLRVDGRTLYAWCAWDTLFLPELIGQRVEVESTCPATGATVSLRVWSDGPRDVTPRQAVLSFLLPTSPLGADSIESFCAFIHYFASPEAAAGWTRQRPGTFVISIEDCFEIGRQTNQSRFGDALAAGG